MRQLLLTSYCLLLSFFSISISAQRHEIIDNNIRSLQVVANQNWLTLPIMYLNGGKISIDFDDNPVPLWCFPLHKTRLVGARTALDTMFHKFRRIGSHLVPVEQNDRIIGIVTVEDLLEETIGHEIADEIDHDLHRN